MLELSSDLIVPLSSGELSLVEHPISEKNKNIVMIEN